MCTKCGFAGVFAWSEVQDVQDLQYVHRRFRSGRQNPGLQQDSPRLTRTRQGLGKDSPNSLRTHLESVVVATRTRQTHQNHHFFPCPCSGTGKSGNRLKAGQHASDFKDQRRWTWTVRRRFAVGKSESFLRTPAFAQLVNSRKFGSVVKSSSLKSRPGAETRNQSRVGSSP
jgi:hypothetical protein